MEVNVAAIHHEERAALDGDFIEDVAVVQFAISDADESGNRAAQMLTLYWKKVPLEESSS